MTNNRLRRDTAWAVPIFSVVAAFAPPASAQGTSASSELSQAIAQLADKRGQERSKGFYRLLKIGSESTEAKGSASVKPAISGLLAKNPQKAEDVKAGLRAALDLENRVAKSGASLSAEFTDYYGDLIQAVAALNDKKSAGALAGALGTGYMVNNALVALGDDSVDAVLQQLGQTQERTVKLSACTVLQKMLDPGNRNAIKDPEHKRKIQQALNEGLCNAGKKN